MSGKAALLIIDDDENVRSQMKWALADEYEILQGADRAEALRLVRGEHPPVVSLDLGLPPNPAGVEEGFKSLEEILAVDPNIKVVVITGQADQENALKAVRQGAYDFFSKPVDVDALKVVLERAFYLYDLELENKRLRSVSTSDSFEGMLGTSGPIQEVFEMVRKVAATDAPVLVTGESGTGKELTARAIHERSRRKQGSFVPINCGAIPENLLESELFGHEKGAFTGAHAQRAGQIESAQSGTLFLDEIGELPLPLQVKLLRFLQDGAIQRVGGRKEIKIDARIIAATNIDLDAAIENKNFREDLYFRLAVVTIRMPPLRERDEDLTLLANAFLQRYSSESRKKLKGFSAEALKAIESYAWPGNVREMENRIRRAVIMAEDSRIQLSDLGLGSSYARFEGMDLRSAREAFEKELVERALSRNQGNMTRVAEDLGVSRPALYDLVDKLGIERK